ncbi:uncharacterized protein (TIGR02453 family) [Chitinophaga terrae (ex Kim and Jung 2007)]|uniref:DUF2461 domain-containing protein n=1 Tax=Chitinophaga terrae (ex Kim and Jung 2007) TaxID=408074 RepID=UPI002780A76C|nr:DUF2461 domain-containing protein [Chitinophaga terrae (ex Kim and Jung 2007)]MDQ0107059.1 uncharacterized protein (TIGR02453 family) [Chitinophaga terrae (ex Kim and Jung 2007)]
MAKKTTGGIGIQKSSFDFLGALKKHNNREWFNEHKDDYLRELKQIEIFADALLEDLSAHDVIETASGKQSLFRIYRDTRFSADKTPYKTHWSGSFKRATSSRRGGYYFHIEQGNSFIGGGFWGPSADDLKKVRDDISFDPSPIKKIINSKLFKSTFGSLEGEQLKKIPRGYDAAHEAADLLRYKQYLLIRRFTDEEVLSPHFRKEAGKAFAAMRPFFDYMSEVLSSDANGL